MSTITHHEVTYADGIKKIHYLATGPEDGPLIIFIHGWPATAITWKRQLDAFASVGFRAIAPDMPGYGQSTARRIADDYCQEAIVEGLMALLADTGRDAAIWVGHDWGSGVVSSVTIQHPEAVTALVNICVPYNTIELGWDGFLPLVDRDIYPEDKYPYGQWDYQKAYEDDFEGTIKWFDQDVAGLVSLFSQKPGPRPDPKVAAEAMATVRKVGWLGGLPKPPSAAQLGPPILPPEIFDSFSADMQKTGFWTGSAYYLHHKRNGEYNGPREHKFTKPALFVHTKWDVICETKNSRLMEPMRENCSNLTEVTIDAAHFVMFEKPVELNAALFRFVVDAVPSQWPGYSDSEYAKTK